MPTLWCFFWNRIIRLLSGFVSSRWYIADVSRRGSNFARNQFVVASMMQVEPTPLVNFIFASCAIRLQSECDVVGLFL